MDGKLEKIKIHDAFSMEAVYLQNNVGKELASALAALHTFGLNSHTDPSQPLKDPIAFLGNYLLEKTRVEQDILQSRAALEPLLGMMQKMKETTQTIQTKRRATLTSLERELEVREAKREALIQIQEDEDKIAEEEAAAAVDETNAVEDEEEPVVVEEQEPEQVEAEERESVAQEETGGEEIGEGEVEQGEEVAE
jgi:hypothetical protein